MPDEPDARGLACSAQFGDFDVYECDLPSGHEGLHHDHYGLVWAIGDPTESGELESEHG